jgi:hypothetical protein
MALRTGASRVASGSSKNGAAGRVEEFDIEASVGSGTSRFLKSREAR